MMRRPSFTASIGPSPVLGFMAAMSGPLTMDTPPLSRMGPTGTKTGGPPCMSGRCPVIGVDAPREAQPDDLARHAEQDEQRSEHPGAGDRERPERGGERHEQAEGARLREEDREQIDGVAR